MKIFSTPGYLNLELCASNENNKETKISLKWWELVGLSMAPEISIETRRRRNWSRKRCWIKSERERKEKFWCDDHELKEFFVSLLFGLPPHLRINIHIQVLVNVFKFTFINVVLCYLCAWINFHLAFCAINAL